MKVYLFNSENGLYEGESFEEPDMIVHEEGITILPPPDHGHGMVPVFDRESKTWTVIPTSNVRQLLNLKYEAASEK